MHLSVNMRICTHITMDGEQNEIKITKGRKKTHQMPICKPTSLQAYSLTNEDCANKNEET